MSELSDKKNVTEVLSHIDAQGKARMIDIGQKSVTRRIASASAICTMQTATADAIRENTLRKGDALQVARLAGIGAAKRTAELIPLCHNLLLDSVDVAFEWLEPTRLKITTTVSASGKTGVEMEALVAASLAALAIYDMCKSNDRELRIEQIELQSKSGGVRGDFKRT